MDIGAAGAEIRAGKPHAGKPCAVRSSSDGADLRLRAHLPEDLTGIFHQMPVVFQGFLHIIVAVFNLNLHRPLAILYIQKFCSLDKKPLFLLKFLPVMIPDNVIGHGGLHVP